MLNPREREIIAFHEMGHALVALAQSEADPEHKVSIIPRGIGALGYTIQRPTEDRYMHTKLELEKKSAVLLGGRAAKKLKFGILSTGAADDLSKASDLAHEMVTRYGMDESPGYVAFEPPRSNLLEIPVGLTPQQRPVSEETQRIIDCAIRDNVMDGFKQATSLLLANRDLLEQGEKVSCRKKRLTKVISAHCRLSCNARAPNAVSDCLFPGNFCEIAKTSSYEAIFFQCVLKNHFVAYEIRQLGDPSNWI